MYPFCISFLKTFLCGLNQSLLIDFNDPFGIQVTNGHMGDAKTQFSKATPHMNLDRILNAALDECGRTCTDHTRGVRTHAQKDDSSVNTTFYQSRSIFSFAHFSRFLYTVVFRLTCILFMVKHLQAYRKL